MVDVVTLIMIILIVIALIITNIYILIYFSHPEDRDSVLGWVLKIIVILGLTLAWAQVLLVPLDVSNNRTFGGGINMKTFWLVIFVITLIYILIIFPVSSSLYDAQDEWTFCEKIKHSICFLLILVIFFVGLTAILYSTIGNADITIKVIEYKKNDYNFINSSIEIIPENVPKPDKSEKENIELRVNIIVYAMAILTFFSWIIFALFGGIGLASVPLDFFRTFSKRPKTLRRGDVEDRKNILFEEVEQLKKLGNEVKNLELNGAHKKFFFSKDKREYNRKKNEFVSRFALVKEEYDILNKNNYLEASFSVVFYYLLIPLGILSSILTILWIIQFCCSYFYIYKTDFRPGYPFLSYMLIFFHDHDVSFLSFIFFSILTLYLLFCIIKGNFQFGVKIFCCWQVHPMEKGKTYMNSFLFNISLILLGSMAITQFVSDCLSDYVAFTDVDTLFNTLIKNLKFFKYFYKYHVFQYILFGIFVLSFFYFMIIKWENPNTISGKGAIHEYKEKEKEEIKKKKKEKNEENTEDGGSQDKKLFDKDENNSPSNNIEEKLDGDIMSKGRNSFEDDFEDYK